MSIHSQYLKSGGKPPLLPGFSGTEVLKVGGPLSNPIETYVLVRNPTPYRAATDPVETYTYTHVIT